MNKETISTTFLDALAEALTRAGQYNKNDQVPPAVVLWPDGDRAFAALIPRLRERLGLLTFDPGGYNQAERRGPAYWIRCMIAGSLPGETMPVDHAPIVYLPGVTRSDLRAVEDCPRALQPLAELQYRGVLWTQRNSRDWTVAAFLQAADGGLGIEVASDTATRDALGRALGKLADVPLVQLRKEAPLRAPFLDLLLNPDEGRNILRWLDDPTGYRQATDANAWASFCDLCHRKYQFHPEKDGPLTAAELLGKREGAWEAVWSRFTEAPERYPHLPALLRSARSQSYLFIFADDEAWPQDNEAGETTLRGALAALKNTLPAEARTAITTLEQEHAKRRTWVWARLRLAPLAQALDPLMILAQTTARSLGGATLADLAKAYTDWGWQADAAVIDALAAGEASDDLKAVKAVILALYRPWLEEGARALQQLISRGLPTPATLAAAPTQASPGTCILFSDSLRYDMAARLAAALEGRGLTTLIGARLGALPGVTPTAKPAVAPIAALLTGKGCAGLEPATIAGGVGVKVEVLRKLLTQSGYQVLRGDETGDPSGRGWTEHGDIDAYGHQHGAGIARHVAGELRSLENRIQALLDAGWQQVVVVTDHGWLMLPDGLPKVDLPEHLTVVRKGRCARLKPTAGPYELTMPWYWDADVRIALAPGIAAFEAGSEYEHGGLSPQESFVPVLTIAGGGSATPTATITDVAWRGLRCTVKLGGSAPDLLVDIRTKAGDATTSLVAAPKAPSVGGTIALLVENDERMGEAAFVVVQAPSGTLCAQKLTTIGGA